MGVTKQAAQKRFVPKASDLGDLLSGAFPPDPVKFSRFTDRAKRAVIAARQEAIKRRHDRVLPEHLTLGMLHEQEGLAARAVAALGVSPEAAPAAIGAVLGRHAGRGDPRARPVRLADHEGARARAA